MSVITLVCPTCGLTKEVPRDPTDPLWAVIAEIECLDCDHGGMKDCSITYQERRPR